MRAFITRKRILLFLAALMAVVVGFRAHYALTRKPDYETMVVSRTAIMQSIEAEGEIRSDSEVELRFPASGKLASLAVKKNDPVKKGSYIGSLDKREFEKRLEESLRAYSKQRNDFEEMRQVTYRDQVITDTIRRSLEKSQWDLDRAVLEVQLGEIARQDADLYSPIAGVVTQVQTPNGTSVTTTTPIVTISDPDHLAFIAEVGESDVAMITVGQEASIALEAFPGKSFRGVVAGVDYAPSVGMNNDKVYLVKIAIEDLPAMKIGMGGDVRIVIARHEDVLVIPRQAIQEQGGQKIVTVLENGEPRRQVVQVGLASPTSAEIVHGLVSGQRLV